MLHQQGTRSPPPGGAGVPCPQCAHSPRGTSGPIHGPSPAGAPSTCSWRPLAPGTTDLGGAMEGLIHERRLDLADIGRLHLRLLSFETRPFTRSLHRSAGEELCRVRCAQTTA